MTSERAEGEPVEDEGYKIGIEIAAWVREQADDKDYTAACEWRNVADAIEQEAKGRGWRCECGKLNADHEWGCYHCGAGRPDEDHEAVQRLTAELEALIAWFNDAPFPRAERLLWDLSSEQQRG